MVKPQVAKTCEAGVAHLLRDGERLSCSLREKERLATFARQRSPKDRLRFADVQVSETTENPRSRPFLRNLDLIRSNSREDQNLRFNICAKQAPDVSGRKHLPSRF